LFGGVKIGNQMCNNLYPGSHWAGFNELIKLGPEYPWTYEVWIWDSRGIVDDTNLGGGSAGSTYSCNGWKDAGYSYKGIGETLRTDGLRQARVCDTSFRLACVK